jgi:hypothetical protein
VAQERNGGWLVTISRDENICSQTQSLVVLLDVVRYVVEGVL